MSSDDDQSSDKLDRDIYAERDVWQIRDSYNVSVNPRQSTEDLKKALDSNRSQFEPLREEYSKAVSQDGGIDKPASRRRKTYFKELNRLYSATEALKDELRRRGEAFHIDENDEEHPNSAYRRYNREWECQRARSNCYLVTAIYGHRSRELTRVKRVCRQRFAFSPLMLPSWLLYKAVGPTLARLASHNRVSSVLLDRMVATPIYKASSVSLRKGLPWLLYLSIFGWAVVALVVLAVMQKLQAT